MKYSVIMPVYNVRDYLENAVNCILDQTFSEWELILVNDGSTDGSGELCNKLSYQDQRIKVFHQENKGSGPARQLGLDNANGDYIVFVDPDDRLSSNALLENKKLLKKYQPDILFNGYTQETLDAYGNPVQVEHLFDKVRYLKRDEFIKSYKKLEKVSTKALWCKVYRRSFLQDNEIEFPDQRVGQDALFNYLAYKYVQKAVVSPGAYYIYDDTRQGSAVNKYNPNRAKFMLRIAEKFEKMVKSWDESDLYKNKIHREYWRAIYSQTQNLSRLDCELTLSEKSKKLKKLYKHVKVQKVFQHLDKEHLNGRLPQIIFILLKNKMFKTSLVVMGLHKRLKAYMSNRK